MSGLLDAVKEAIDYADPKAEQARAAVEAVAAWLDGRKDCDLAHEVLRMEVAPVEPSPEWLKAEVDRLRTVLWRVPMFSAARVAREHIAAETGDVARDAEDAEMYRTGWEAGYRAARERIAKDTP